MSDPTRIENHSGKKYLRLIHGCASAEQPKEAGRAVVDVYAVIVAYEVTCPGVQHALKKLLASGLRDKGSRKQDLCEARDAILRAIELEATPLA